MTRLVGRSLWVVSLAMVGFIPMSSEAFGRRNRCESSCAPPVCVEVCAPAPEVRYEERKVTYLKPTWKERVIEDTVVRCVPREEKFVYNVQVQKFKDETRVVKVYKPVTRQENYVVKVAYAVHSVEKRTVACNVPVWRDVEYSYTCNIPKFRQVSRSVPYCTWETKHVETTVPVCRVVPEVCTDSCGRCYTVCRTVTEMVPTTRCIRVPVHGTRDVLVNECYFEQETRKGVRKVCDFQRQEREIEVPVCQTAYRDVEQTRTVCEYQTVDQEVTYRVCYHEAEQREGTRVVMDRVEDKVKRTVRVCEYETVTDTVRVAVGGDCGSSYVSYCNDCGRGRRGRCCR